MKITIVLGAFFPVPPVRGGAVEKSWLLLGEEFAARDHDVTIISRRFPGQPRSETLAGVTHRRVEGFEMPASRWKIKVFDFFYSWRVRRELPAADILVSNTFWLPLLVRHGAAGRIYVSVGRYPKGQMRFYRRAARLQSPSRPIAEAIRREAPHLASKIVTIPYPAPALRSPLPPWAERLNRITYVGRIHPEKGVHLLIDAFARLNLRDWELMVVGPMQINEGGGGKSYQHSLEKRAAGQRVIFQGPIFDQAGLTAIYCSTRLFVYPSLADRGETFGLAPLEAMSHGCAVLVSDLPCFRDFIEPGETGFNFNHHASDPGGALAEALQKCTNDSANLFRVADNGVRKAAEFSVSRVANRLLEDFKSLL